MARLRVIAVAIDRKGAEIWAKQANLQVVILFRAYNQNKGKANSGNLLTQRRGGAENNIQNRAIFKTLKRFPSALLRLCVKHFFGL